MIISLRKIKSYFCIHDIFVLLGFFSLLKTQLQNFANDPGVGWHLMAGKLISKGQIPYLDTFLASSKERLWVADQWLSDLVLYLLYKIGSFQIIYVLLSIFFLGLFFVFCWGKARKFSGFSLAASIAVLIAFKISQIHFILRPVIFSFGLFALLYFFLLEKLPADNRVLFKTKEKISLFILFLLWANVHPSFVLGFFLLFLFILSVLLSSELKGDVLNFIITCLVIFAATLCNPYFIQLHFSIFKLGASTYFMKFHQEWNPVDLAAYSGQLFLLLGLINLPALLKTKDLNYCSNKFIKLSFLSFFGLCFYAVRFLPYFAICSIILTSLTLGKFGSYFRNTFKFYLPIITAKFKSAELHDLKYAHKNIAFLAFSVFLLVSLSFTQKIPFYSGSFGPSENKFPYAEVKWIMENSTEVSPVVLAPPSWGGFIVFLSDMKLKPVLDDRNTLVGEDLYKSYFNIFDNEYGLSKFLNNKKISYLISPGGGTVSEQAEKLISFKKVYEGKVAEVFHGIRN
ncbi:MAG: hypothetical protein KDD56_00440 [Bdellovibrionales bacterium]|nr:hypothetical protein [Bdellovibrionales bacterium]